MVNQLAHMLTKVKYMLFLESKLSAQEVALNQWQFLANHHGVVYIVGRGGSNTCFYKIGDGERSVCYPDQLVEFLKKRSSSKYSSYRVYTKDRKLVQSGISTLDEALAIVPKKAGLLLVGVESSTKRRLYYSVAGLKQNSWVKYAKK